jgi:hypothetical protein
MGSNSEENVESEHILDGRVSGPRSFVSRSLFSNILARHRCSPFGL